MVTMDLTELRTELLEMVLEHVELEHKRHKQYNKAQLKYLTLSGPQPQEVWDRYKPKQYTMQEIMQMAKQLEVYITTGTIAG
jgi:hypothetical protein